MRTAINNQPEIGAAYNTTVTWWVVLACFLLSGFAGLLYQTVWMRQFGVVFGTAESAVVATLAAYMAGLGLGAFLAGHFVTQLKRPLLAYIILEVGIAVSALCVPHFIDLLGQLLNHAVLFGWINAQSPNSSILGVYVAGTLLVLMLPTTLMGATLPVLLRFVIRSDEQVGQRTSILYGINTLGAVLGVLVTGFILLPAIPLPDIVMIGVLINILAAAGAAALRKAARVSVNDPAPTTKTGASRSSTLILAAMAASGVVSFSLEVMWTRLLGHIAGSSIYAFAVMLATFLTGIGLGSTLAQKFSHTQPQAFKVLAWTQLGIAVSSTLTYVCIGQFLPESQSWGAILILSAFVMLPATLLIGATFPLAVRAAVGFSEDAPVAAGKIYAANTMGAIAGVVLAGFILLPNLDFSGTVKAVGAISLIIATILFSAVPHSWRQALTASLCLFALVAAPLSRPDAVVGASTLAGKKVEGDELFYSVGRSATVFAKEFNGYINLRTNGLPEASIATLGSPPVRNSQQWLGALPALARPDARTFLVVGLGGGVALEGLPNDPSLDITVVEIEAEVLTANKTFESKRRIPVLDRSNVSIVINDARSALGLSPRTFDVIISQPSHPWTAGSSHLYTREFIALAKRRLTADGVFLQWINAAFLDEELLRSLAATLTGQFRHVLLFHPAPGVLEFIASDAALVPSFDQATLRQTLKDRPLLYGDIGIRSDLDVLASMLLTSNGVETLGRDAVPNTDNLNRLATRSRSKGNGLTVKDITILTRDTDALCGSRTPHTPYSLSTAESFYIQRQWLLSGFNDRAASCLKKQSVPTKALAAAYAMLLQQKMPEAINLLELATGHPEAIEAASYLLAKFSLLGIYDKPASTSGAMGSAASATLSAWEAAQRNNWDRVEALDDLLSLSAPGDIWYQDAAKLMSEWRIRKSIGTGDARYLGIALAIIDSALSAQWTEELLVLRAGVGVLMSDQGVYLSTVEGYLNLVELRLEESAISDAKADIDPVTQQRIGGIAKQLDGAWLTGRELQVQRIQSRISALNI